MDLEKILISSEQASYKCFDVLKRLIKEDEKFYEVLKTGIEINKVSGFSNDLWEKIKSQNMRDIDSFTTIFKEGINIGGCTKVSEQLSYSFPYCYLCGGILGILKGTRNCPDGRHSWILVDNKIIDTTLMLIIDEDYAKNFGYIETNRYDPSINAFYNMTKEFTNDSNLRKN